MAGITEQVYELSPQGLQTYICKPGTSSQLLVRLRRAGNTDALYRRNYQNQWQRARDDWPTCTPLQRWRTLDLKKESLPNELKLLELILGE